MRRIENTHEIRILIKQTNEHIKYNMKSNKGCAGKGITCKRYGFYCSEFTY